MKTSFLLLSAFALLPMVPVQGQETPPAGEFTAGAPLGATNEAGEFVPMSDNVKVYGSFRFAESVTYDSRRDLIVVMNAGVPQNMQENDGYVSLLHPDGSVHTTKWIGATRDGLILNHPLGSAIHDGVLYAADIDVVRTFDLETGKPGQAWPVPDATGLNGIGVAADGTVYVSNTRGQERVYRITKEGEVSVFVEGEPLKLPNGVAVDPDGHVVVVNAGDNRVMTFGTDGALIKTEEAVEGGNDGLVILQDGTKYVSSVRYGSISRIRPGQKAEIIAAGIPNAASMGYDSKQHRLLIPMNNHNALAFLALEN